VKVLGDGSGAICWFEYGGSDSTGNDRITPLKGLGLIQGSCTPRYDGESNRRPDLHWLVKNNKLPLGIAINDGAAVLFHEQQIIEVVASRPTAKAYQIKLEEDGQVIEEPLETRYLC
jgi:dipeptidase E